MGYEIEAGPCGGSSSSTEFDLDTPVLRPNDLWLRMFDRQLLEQTVRLYEHAASTLPHDHSNRPAVLFTKLYLETGLETLSLEDADPSLEGVPCDSWFKAFDAENLTIMITVLEHAVDTLPDDNPDLDSIRLLLPTLRIADKKIESATDFNMLTGLPIW